MYQSEVDVDSAGLLRRKGEDVTNCGGLCLVPDVKHDAEHSSLAGRLGVHVQMHGVNLHGGTDAIHSVLRGRMKMELRKLIGLATKRNGGQVARVTFFSDDLRNQ